MRRNKNKLNGNDIPRLFDTLDLHIMNVISDNPSIPIMDLVKKTKQVHGVLLRHLKRISPFINREREKKTIKISLTEDGQTILKIFNRYSQK